MQKRGLKRKNTNWVSCLLGEITHSLWWLFLIRLSFPFLFAEKELLAYKMQEKDGILVDGDSEGKTDCVLYVRGKTSITIV